MDLQLLKEELELVNRLLEWINLTRVAGIENAATTHLDVDRERDGYGVGVWVHFEAYAPKRFSDEQVHPTLGAALTALLAILPPPEAAAQPIVKRDTERVPPPSPAEAVAYHLPEASDEQLDDEARDDELLETMPALTPLEELIQ